MIIPRSKKISSTRGFTIIELLVVIAIIGLLSSVILASLAKAREKANIAKAQTQATQIRNGIALMSLDTGVWPNGCNPGDIIGPDEPGGNNEISLIDDAAGLFTRPSVGSGDNEPPHCHRWTEQEVNNWQGPYINFDPVDPWGTPYWFDSDYESYADCPSMPPGGTLVAVISAGPNTIGPPYKGGTYDCDNVFVRLY